LTIRSHVQRTSLGARVTLYYLNLSTFGLEDFFITGGPKGGAAVSFGGQVFSPWPVTAEGFELTTGKLPTPTFTMANIGGVLDPMVELHEDLVGAQVMRIRTYDRYLDDGPEPDGTAHLPIDVYETASLDRHDGEVVSWRLRSLIDQEGVTLPGRQCVRDYCDHVVRRWDASTGLFDYSKATCPYNESYGPARDVNGNICPSPDEVFSKRLGTCCQARFGQNVVLPFRGFPGVARLRER
jgi:lambda family phage minor tail protein L